MSILRLEHVRREIGDFVILDGIDAAIADGERIGLVGANGAGKTTLLRVVARLDEPDAGTVSSKRGLVAGILAQEANLDATFAGAPTVRIVVRAGAVELEALERRLTELERQGPEGVEGAEYAALRERFEMKDGYHLDQRVDETLSGLGIPESDRDRPPLRLSGGEQTRVALARLLVSDPDLLLLDEPTNHLDIAAIEWLETALARRTGAVLVASHDRAFLDAVVTRIWELRDRRLESFRGDYSAYLVQREARDARLRKDAAAGAAAAAREQELIQRYRSHRKFAKMHEHERRLEQLERVEAPRQRARIALPATALVGGGPVRSGDLVVALHGLVAGFRPSTDARDGVPVVDVRRLEAARGDRIGIVGPNGVGKTTLLRTIAGDLSPLSGFVRLGAAVQPGYLAQLRGRALTGTTVLDALLAASPVDNGVARSYLARFLFRGEEVFKPVSELSGGERSRLELALLGITPANLLLLDEPTNHLDIPAREALESFLRETPSTLLIVSHDRRLLEGICDRLWVIASGAPGQPARAAAFEGGYRDWRAAAAEGWTVDGELELQSRRLDGRPMVQAAANVRSVEAVAGDPMRASPASARATGRAADGRRGREGALAAAPPASASAPRLSKDAYRRQRTLVEEDLTRLGLRKSQIELALGQPAVQTNYVELRRLTSELADVDAALGLAEDAWLALAERAPR